MASSGACDHYILRRDTILSSLCSSLRHGSNPVKTDIRTWTRKHTHTCSSPYLPCVFPRQCSRLDSEQWNLAPFASSIALLVVLLPHAMADLLPAKRPVYTSTIFVLTRRRTCREIHAEFLVLQGRHAEGIVCMHACIYKYFHINRLRSWNLIRVVVTRRKG